MRASPPRIRQRGFFDFSITEIAIIFGVALVVLGPKKLPGLVAQVGRWVGRARHMARQFREQLEQEVNSINAVKPVPRNVQPEVGPATPSPEVAAARAAAAGDHTDLYTPPAPAAVLDPVPATPETTGEMAAVHPSSETHPEAQMYFAMNGSQPEVVMENPHVAAVDPSEPQGDLFAAAPAPGADAAPQAADPASVKVIFPHDHG